MKPAGYQWVNLLICMRDGAEGRVARGLRHETARSQGCADVSEARDETLRAAMNVIGNGADQECGRWLNNHAENSHQPFRRREGAMLKFRDVKTLQKFGSIHASIHNHFNPDRHLNNREDFKNNRSAALAEWRQIAA